MIGKRFFVNWLHIFKMKKLRHVESDKLSAGYFYFGLNAQKQKKRVGHGAYVSFLGQIIKGYLQQKPLEDVVQGHSNQVKYLIEAQKRYTS